MTFLASLNTSRHLERPVHYYGPTKDAVESLAVKWLDANGNYGDSFSICEFVRSEVAVIHCDKPEETPAPREFKGHAPVFRDGVERCQKCNRLESEHV